MAYSTNLTVINVAKACISISITTSVWMYIDDIIQCIVYCIMNFMCKNCAYTWTVKEFSYRIY